MEKGCRRIIALLIPLLIFVLSCENQVDASWHMEEVDAPHLFGQFHERSMAISPDGTVHIAYGGDHLYHAWYDGNAWNYETVDPSPQTGEDISLSIGTSGKVHIIYSGDDFLKYASNVSGVWVIEEVDNCISFDLSLALDSNDTAHISYSDYTETEDDLKYATNASGSWIIETVETVDITPGYCISLSLDSNGKAHISYSTRDGLIKYATNISGAWTTEVIVDSDFGWCETSIAVDSNDKVHISYSDINLKYATNLSGLWTTEVVGSNKVSYPSLALDANNKAHISYFDATTYDLKYATNTSGTWSTVRVSEGSQSSLALAASESIRIAYLNYPDLKYAWCDAECGNTSNWHIEAIDRSDQVGRYNSLALDSNDKAHISYASYYYYHSVYFSDLKYATNASGSWMPEMIDQSRTLSEVTSLALDQNDKAHISCWNLYFTNVTGSWVRAYPGIKGFTSLALDANNGVYISYHDNDNDLKYVTNATGSWVQETVDSIFGAGQHSSLAIDSSGKIHIGYLANGSLKYATNRSGSWETEILGEGGLYPSLALDSNDKAHISYGSYYGDLKYTTNITGSWVVETVDGGGGYSSSLALDSSDKVHISYFHQHTLKYATNPSGSWEIETIDNSGCSGDYTSIAIDSHGKVHISYDDCNYDLKYIRQCPETDIDCDEIGNDDDNCLYVYNSNQEDTYPLGGNGCGDACECHADSNADQKVDLADLVIMKQEFLRTDCDTNPCNADCNYDNSVDLADLVMMKEDFFRSDCPVCP